MLQVSFKKFLKITYFLLLNTPNFLGLLKDNRWRFSFFESEDNRDRYESDSSSSSDVSAYRDSENENSQSYHANSEENEDDFEEENGDAGGASKNRKPNSKLLIID